VILTFDLNVLVDLLTRRAPFYRASRRVLFAVKRKAVAGIFPAHGVTTVYYLVRRISGRARANLAVDFILRHFIIGRFDAITCAEARRSALDDFEDAAVEQTAVRSQSSFIITRDVTDFAHSIVPAISPTEFLRRFAPPLPTPQTPP
jgi:hypothetical protein